MKRWLTDSDVQEIRALAREGACQIDIAAKFGVARPTISNIVRGARRTDVPASDLPSHGDVLPRPKLSLEARFLRLVEVKGEGECWPWGGERNSSGYGIFWKGEGGGSGGRTSAHRMAWVVANGREIPSGLHVLHSCDCPPCVNPAHLRVGTPADNGRDKAERGRCADQWGENNPATDLTEREVRDIRTLREWGARGVDLAAEYGVSQQAICGIVKRRSWRRVA